MSTATAPKTGTKDTASLKAGNPAALSINASAGPAKTNNSAAGETEYRSMLASQNTGTERKQAPLPDLPARQSYLNSGSSQSTTSARPITFTTTPSLTREDAKAVQDEAQAWVAHSDGRTNDIKSAPELKSALPAKVEQNLTDRDAQYASSKTPLAKDLAQAAKAGQPVAWVAHKDGRLEDVDSVPALAEALPAKVSNKLTTGRRGRRGGSGFFSKVLHGTFQIAKVAAIVGLTAVATDRLQKEYYARKGCGNINQDGPVKPVADRGLLGRKV